MASTDRIPELTGVPRPIDGVEHDPTSAAFLDDDPLQGLVDAAPVPAIGAFDTFPESGHLSASQQRRWLFFMRELAKCGSGMVSGRYVGMSARKLLHDAGLLASDEPANQEER